MQTHYQNGCWLFKLFGFVVVFLGAFVDLLVQLLRGILRKYLIAIWSKASDSFSFPSTCYVWIYILISNCLNLFTSFVLVLISTRLVNFELYLAHIHMLLALLWKFSI